MDTFLKEKPKKILIRSTNWIGDAIMTLPAIRSIRMNFPDSEISVLANPWVSDIFSANPAVDKIVHYYKNTGLKKILGVFQLGSEIAKEGFEMAILLQNAFEAAIIARLGRIPIIAGYCHDGRRLLLTHPVTVSKEIKNKHQINYYQDLLAQLGLKTGPDSLELHISQDKLKKADEMSRNWPRPFIGINPGAAYGPAKRWPAEHFGELVRSIRGEINGTTIIFGTKADSNSARKITSFDPNIIDLTGKTSLSVAMALIKKCNAFVTNDSGLMHVAAAANTPLVAIFGSTDATTTGPFTDKAKIIQKNFSCIPCLKPECTTDFKCMTAISPNEVFESLIEILDHGN